MKPPTEAPPRDHPFRTSTPMQLAASYCHSKFCSEHAEHAESHDLLLAAQWALASTRGIGNSILDTF